MLFMPGAFQSRVIAIVSVARATAPHQPDAAFWRLAKSAQPYLNPGCVSAEVLCWCRNRVELRMKGERQAYERTIIVKIRQCFASSKHVHAFDLRQQRLERWLNLE